MLINMCVDVAAYHGFCCLRSVCASELSCLIKLVKILGKLFLYMRPSPVSASYAEATSQYLFLNEQGVKTNRNF
jgi:hypothetical protein